MWVLLLAIGLGCANGQYVKTANYGVKGGYNPDRQYLAGDYLNRFYGNNTQTYGSQNYSAPAMSQVGVCYIEVPTASLVRNPSQVPMGNGSRPDLSRIRSCCKGYIRNIHNFLICDPVCTEECVNALCTGPEICTCFPDHVRNAAGFCVPTCPIGCQNGHCAGGECLCREGYVLDSDSKYCVPHCRDNCGGLGNCTAPNTCTCRAGYSSVPGGPCQPICDKSCINGDCVAPNDCRCRSGFIKNQQGICEPYCSQGCGPSGQCVSPGVCSNTFPGRPDLSSASYNPHGPNTTPIYQQYPPNYPQYPTNQSNINPYNPANQRPLNSSYPSNGYPNQQNYPDFNVYHYPGNVNNPSRNISSESQMGPSANYPTATSFPVTGRVNNQSIYPNLNNAPQYATNQPSVNFETYQPNYPNSYPYQPTFNQSQYPYNQDHSTSGSPSYMGQNNQQIYRPNQPYQPGQSNQATYFPNIPNANQLGQMNQTYYPGQNYPGSPLNNSSYYSGQSYQPGYYPGQPNQPVNYPGQVNEPGYHPGQHNQPVPNSGHVNQPSYFPGQSSYQNPFDQNNEAFMPQCPKPCINGVCGEGNRCTCNPGYVMDEADPTRSRCLPFCAGGCTNGVCSAPNFCICNMGYRKEVGVKGRGGCVRRMRRSAGVA